MDSREENIRFARQFDLKPEVFSTTTITVELQRRAAGRRGNVAAFLLATNLLSRMFDRVHAVFPPGAAVYHHPWGLRTVDAAMHELRIAVGGALRIGAPERSDVVLSIEDRPSLPGDRQVFVHGSHWRAALDCELRGPRDGVLGFLYAATMGASQVLLHALELAGARYKPMEAFSFSILDHLSFGPSDQSPVPLALPEAHLVGVGAVGSAAVYALAHLDDLHGTLHLIDNEKVDGTSNLNRYVLTRREDVGRWKVDVAADALRGTGIRAEPYRDVFANYIREHGTKVDILLTPIDSEEGRRRLAMTLPRRVINAATGGTTITISTHGFADGNACLHCLYLPEPNESTPEEIMARDMGLSRHTVEMLVEMNDPIDAQLVERIERNRGAEPGTWSGYAGLPIQSFYVRAVCGDAELRLPTANVIAPLPFISAAAGILLAAELAKAGHADLRTAALDNYFRTDTLRRPNPAFRFRRPQDASGRCICVDSDYVAVYEEKYPSA